MNIGVNGTCPRWFAMVIEHRTQGSERAGSALRPACAARGGRRVEIRPAPVTAPPDTPRLRLL